MTAETKKILDPTIELVAHCVRIPVLLVIASGLY